MNFSAIPTKISPISSQILQTCCKLQHRATFNRKLQLYGLIQIPMYCMCSHDFFSIEEGLLRSLIEIIIFGTARSFVNYCKQVTRHSIFILTVLCTYCMCSLSVYSVVCRTFQQHFKHKFLQCNNFQFSLQKGGFQL